jgi:hypothetical protein
MSNQANASKHMTAPFEDDSYQSPNLAYDGIIPKVLQPELRPWWDLEEVRKWTPPTYPWWVNPPTPPALPDPPPGSYPYWVIPPAPPTLPSPTPGTGRPINSFPVGGSATDAAPAAGGLLGMLYAMMQQSEPKPDGGFDSSPQDVSQQALPERRLGRRTYRP